jgi:hypothetical protein
VYIDNLFHESEGLNISLELRFGQAQESVNTLGIPYPSYSKISNATT